MNVALRALALALVVTGAAASNHIARASQPAIGAKTSFMPIPMCPPDGSQGDCGMCQFSRSCTVGN